jgi:hypothetical protein
MLLRSAASRWAQVQVSSAMPAGMLAVQVATNKCTVWPVRIGTELLFNVWIAVQLESSDSPLMVDTLGNMLTA